MLVAKLYYIADPMCSWCWGFSPVLESVVANLPSTVELHYVMGGLAPDSDEPMAEEMQGYVQSAWRQVATTTGAEFNHEFWDKCQPRRSTYPACRAVIAAGLQSKLPEMFAALQRAYYLEARNPSDRDTHLAVAQEIGLDAHQFSVDLESERVEDLMQRDFKLRSSLGVQGFPSLVYETDGICHWIAHGWGKEDAVWERLKPHLDRQTA